jgi:aminoglycoside 6'-N-acetyltransferase
VRQRRDISFRPVTTGHYPILADWLQRPHWCEQWGDPATEPGYIKEMIEGRDPHRRPFIFSFDGRDMGYIQVWRFGSHQTPEWAADKPG